MKIVLSFLVLIQIITGFAQPVVPFVDFNNYFRVFENNNFRTIEMQPIISYQAGDEFVAYMDNRENLRIFDGLQDLLPSFEIMWLKTASLSMKIRVTIP